MKGKLDEKMRKVTEFCISLEEVQKLLCEVFIRCDNYGTEELKVVDRYFGQQFFKEEPKMCLTIAHIEQAKNFLKNNYRLFVEGHFDCVAGTLVSSDNKLVVSAGDETIRIWDLEKMTQEGMIQCQESSILSITLTRNLKYIIGGGSDSVVYVWDFNDRKAKCELRGHSKSVLCLAVGKSNEIVVSGGGDGKVKVWNFVQKFLMANFDAHSNRVKSLIFTKDSKFIVSGGWDENVKIWKFKKKSLFMSINFRPDYVNSVCLTENSLLVAGHGNKISLYNLNFKKFEKTIKAHEYRVNSLFLAKTGKYLASAGQDKILKLWFMNELTLFKQFDLKIDITSICFSIDGSAIIVGCEDKTLKRVTISKEEVSDFQSHTESVTCIKGTPENQFIITGGNDNDIRIWSLKDRVSIAVLHGHSDWVTSLFVIPNNKYLISGGSDKIVRIWNLKSYKCEYELKGSKFEITSITYSPLTNLLVTGTEALALVWRIKDEKLSSFGFSS
jgi:WD40 repeat protein